MFWKVWVGGFCVFLLIFAFSMWVLKVSGRMSERNIVASEQMADPAFFAQAIFRWFLIWPYLLLGGVVIFFQNPDDR